MIAARKFGSIKGSHVGVVKSDVKSILVSHICKQFPVAVTAWHHGSFSLICMSQCHHVLSKLSNPNSQTDNFVHVI